MSDSPTSKMKIDILAHYKDKDMFESLPILNQFKEFINYKPDGRKKGGLNKNMVIAYIIILFSEDSILNRQPMPSLDQRQIMAAELVGFKKNKNDEFDDSIKNNLFDLNNDQIRKMAFSYLVYQRSPDYQLLMATETLRLSFLKDMMTHGSTDALTKKAKLSAQIKEMNIEIEQLKRDIFTDHEKMRDEGKKKLWGDTIETII